MYGWHTADLRRAIRNARRELLKEHDLAFVLSVADLVFSGSNNMMVLVHSLLGPMIVSKPVRVRNVFRWAKSDNRWLRRAACVSLIQGTRRGMFFPEIRGLAVTLLQDDDDMVQKASGGCCVRPLKPTQFALFRCSIAFAIARPGLCFALLAKLCPYRPAEKYCGDIQSGRSPSLAQTHAPLLK